jgi:type I restriction enzyme S subunit
LNAIVNTVGWRQAELREFMVESDDRAGTQVDLPLLSITKYDGAVLAKERFSRVLAGKDLTRYRVARRSSVVIDPMLLWDGVIALQHRFDAGLVSPDYRVFRLADGVDEQFFDYLAHANVMRRQYAAAARGTNVRRRRINRDDFLSIKVLMPPAPEQRKIAAVVGAVDDAIVAAEAVVEQLRAVEQALLRELMATAHGARNVALADLIEEGPRNGLYKPADQIGRGHLIAGMTAIEDGGLAWSRCRRAAASGDELSRFGLRAGDLLVTRVYAHVEGIGRFVRVDSPPEPAVYESNMMRLRLRPDLAVPAFVAYAMALPDARKQIEQRATLAAQASINSNALRALAVRLPPLPEQQRIVSTLSGVRDRRRAEEAVLREHRRLSAALADALLTGRIRVRPADDV